MRALGVWEQLFTIHTQRTQDWHQWSHTWHEHCQSSLSRRIFFMIRCTLSGSILEMALSSQMVQAVCVLCACLGMNAVVALMVAHSCVLSWPSFVLVCCVIGICWKSLQHGMSETDWWNMSALSIQWATAIQHAHTWNAVTSHNYICFNVSKLSKYAAHRSLIMFLKPWVHQFRLKTVVQKSI